MVRRVEVSTGLQQHHPIYLCFRPATSRKCRTVILASSTLARHGLARQDLLATRNHPKSLRTALDYDHVKKKCVNVSACSSISTCIRQTENPTKNKAAAVMFKTVSGVLERGGGLAQTY